MRHAVNPVLHRLSQAAREHPRLLAAAAVVLIVLAGVWFLLVPLFFNSGPPTPDVNYARIVASGSLRTCLDPSFPPFEVTGEGNEIVGFDADLARVLARRLGLCAEFVLTGFDALYADLAAQHCDLIISALPYDRLKTRDVAYSDVYFRGGAVLLVRSDDTEVKSMADTGGKLVGVELGTNAETVAKQLERRNNFQSVRFNSLEDAARALDAGTVRAVMADSVSAHLILRAHPALQVLDPPLTDEPNYVAAVPLDSPSLLETVNRHLRAMTKDGTLQRLVAQWF